MRILLDECVPVQVRNALVGHEVATARKESGIQLVRKWRIAAKLLA